MRGKAEREQREELSSALMKLSLEDSKVSQQPVSSVSSPGPSPAFARALEVHAGREERSSRPNIDAPGQPPGYTPSPQRVPEVRHQSPHRLPSTDFNERSPAPDGQPYRQEPLDLPGASFYSTEVEVEQVQTAYPHMMQPAFPLVPLYMVPRPMAMIPMVLCCLITSRR